MTTISLTLYTLLTVLACALSAFALYILWQNFRDVPPYFPSRLRDVREAFATINLGPQHRFIDLGCGDGRVVFTAAKAGARTTGVDVNFVLIGWCRLRARLSPVRPKPQFHHQSLSDTDLKPYNVVYTYLFPNTMRQLAPKLYSELAPGSYIISNTFRIPDHEPVNTIGHIYVYQT